MGGAEGGRSEERRRRRWPCSTASSRLNSVGGDEERRERRRRRTEGGSAGARGGPSSSVASAPPGRSRMSRLPRQRSRCRGWKETVTRPAASSSLSSLSPFHAASVEGRRPAHPWRGLRRGGGTRGGEAATDGRWGVSDLARETAAERGRASQKAIDGRSSRSSRLDTPSTEHWRALGIRPPEEASALERRVRQ